VRDDKPNDRVKLFYVEETGREVELPLRILVVGSFSNRKEWKQDAPEIVQVDLGNLDEMMQLMNIDLYMDIEVELLDSKNTELSLRLQLKRFEDFHPDSLVQLIPEARALLELREAIFKVKRSQKLFAEDKNILKVFEDTLVSMIAGKHVKKFPYDFAIAKIDETISRLINAVLHQEDFVRVEKLWRGLDYLFRFSPFDNNCRVDILDITREELLDNFDYCDVIHHSWIYKIVYSDEFSLYGGEPYSAVLLAESITPEARDMDFLEYMANISHMAHALILAEADASFFSHHEFNVFDNDELLSSWMSGTRFKRWNQLRSKKEVRNVGLFTPSFMLRPPYHYQYDQIQSFRFTEEGGPLYGNSGFAYACNMIRSFCEFRWCLHTTGEDGGLVQLPDEAERSLDESFHPYWALEQQLSERQEKELIEEGFSPLCWNRQNGHIYIHAAFSVAKIEDKILDRDHYFKQVLEAQLPYNLVVSRLAHYLKVIQRDKIGSMTNANQLEEELNTWLTTYVSDSDNPLPSVRARRPLRHARIKVSPISGLPGIYKMNLSVVPHFKHMGMVINLSTDGELGIRAS
jgi:type VI secretion system protein ImpC